MILQSTLYIFNIYSRHVYFKYDRLKIDVVFNKKKKDTTITKTKERKHFSPDVWFIFTQRQGLYVGGSETKWTNVNYFPHLFGVKWGIPHV